MADLVPSLAEGNCTEPTQNALTNGLDEDPTSSKLAYGSYSTMLGGSLSLERPARGRTAFFSLWDRGPSVARRWFDPAPAHTCICRATSGTRVSSRERA